MLEGFVFFSQMQIGESHVQVCVLSECIALGSDLSECFGSFGKYAGLKVRQSQHIKCVSSWSIFLFQIIPERGDRLVIISKMIIGISQNPIHFRGVFVLRIGRQIILCYDLCLVIILFDGVNLGDIIGHQCLVFCVILQGEKAFQCFVIPFLRITYV